MTKLSTTLLLMLFTLSGLAQKNSEEFRKRILADEYLDKTNIKNEFIKYDISSLLTQTKNSRVLGFIGDNYQRIRIKLISVIKNKENPGQYFVYGKSMVKDNVCEFQGTINVTHVFHFKNFDVAGIKQGKVVGDYLFYENPLQKHVGQFKESLVPIGILTRKESLSTMICQTLPMVSPTMNSLVHGPAIQGRLQKFATGETIGYRCLATSIKAQGSSIHPANIT